MCTVTYLPLYKNVGSDTKATGYVLTSNRDEKTLRPAAELPAIHEVNGQKLAFPRDPQGKGTWIATHECGSTVCLLNGGFQPHIPNPPYKYSRGLVAIDYFLFDTVETFAKEYEFEGIEPFTLVVVENFALYQLRWDGNTIFKKELDTTKPHIWSSVTLYSPETIAKRETWFSNWLKNNAQFSPLNSRLIMDFHRFAGDGDAENSVLMNRDGFLRTVSITSVARAQSSTEMSYIDLMKNQETKIKLPTEYAHS